MGVRQAKPALPVPFKQSVFSVSVDVVYSTFFFPMCEINHRSTVVSVFLSCALVVFLLKCLQIEVTDWSISSGGEMCSGAEYPQRALIIRLRKGEKHVSVSAG